MKNVILRAVACGIIGFAAHSAIAGDLPNFQNSENSPSLPLSLMNYSGGNDWTRYEIAPNWSRELGWSLKGAFGSYVTNDLAVGAIVEYGQDKREYLTNAGIRLSDKISFIGSVGMLEEHREFVADAGKETVQQMEYGASLKGAYDFGLFRGFELNGYLADANAKSDDIETGKLYGTQILTNVNLSDSTRIKIGGGYEWLRWDEGEENNAVSFRADGVQKITNNLSANANVKLGASEYVYGGGLAYNLGDRNNTNIIGLNYEYIEGQHGIQNDQRIELSWRMGLGVGPNSQSSGKYSKGGNSSRLNADMTSNASANNFLADVMKRPEFLPKRALARARNNLEACPVPSDPSYAPVVRSWDNNVGSYPNRYFNSVYDLSTFTFYVYIIGTNLGSAVIDPTTIGSTTYNYKIVSSDYWSADIDAVGRNEFGDCVLLRFGYE